MKDYLEKLNYKSTKTRNDDIINIKETILE